MKRKLFLGALSLVAVWISSAIGIAIADVSKGKNIADVGVPMYQNPEIALFLGGIIYLLIFELTIWGINKTIGKDTRFLHWFWIVPVLLWTPVHFWVLLTFTSF